MRSIVFGLLFFFYAGQSARSGSKVDDLKLFQSEHLAIYTIGEFKQQAPLLAEAGEAFLTDLEARWSIRLPTERFAVTLARDERLFEPANHLEGPPWLQANYNRKTRRISLILRNGAPKDRMGPLIDALNHFLIHRVLDLNPNNKLPLYFEEGLAQYYGDEGSTSDTAVAIWGFNRYPVLTELLENPDSFHDRFTYFYGAAIAKRFIIWLWTTYPNVEISFIQKFLSNRSLDLIYSDFSWESDRQLIMAFQAVAAPQYKWHAILFTADFWLISMSCLLWLWMLWLVIQAGRTARMKFVEDRQQAGASLGAEAFQGPAFDPRAQKEIRRTTTGRPKPLMQTPEISLPPLPQPEMQPPMPGFSDSEGSVSLPLIPIQPEAMAPRDSWDSVSLPPRPSQPEALAAGAGLEEALENVEEELDQFFDGMLLAGTGLPPKPGSPQHPNLDEDLDRIFDNMED